MYIKTSLLILISKDIFFSKEFILVNVILPISLIIVLGFSLNSVYTNEEFVDVKIYQNIDSKINSSQKGIEILYSNDVSKLGDAFLFLDENIVKTTIYTTDPIKISYIETTAWYINAQVNNSMYGNINNENKINEVSNLKDNFNTISSFEYYYFTMTILSIIYLFFSITNSLVQFLRSNLRTRLYKFRKLIYCYLYILYFIFTLLLSFINSIIIYFISDNWIFNFKVCFVIFLIYSVVYLMSLILYENSNASTTTLIHLIIPVLIFFGGGYIKFDFYILSKLSIVYYFNKGIMTTYFSDNIFNIYNFIILLVLILLLLFKVGKDKYVEVDRKKYI